MVYINYNKTQSVVQIRTLGSVGFTWVFIGHVEAFAHVLQDAKRLQINPRFTHTFGDEDFMSQLKKWARRGHGRRREQVISRLSRMRFKTLRWKLGELKNRVR